MSRTLLLMRRACLVILASLCLSAAARAQSPVIFLQFSYHEGKQYESKVTIETLESSPVWADGQENPPLPARRAVELASARLSKIVPDASKWGLQGLSGCMAEDLRDHGIRVSVVCPGSVATEFSGRAKEKMDAFRPGSRACRHIGVAKRPNPG